MKRRKIFCIGDIHFPYVSQARLDSVYEAIRREHPTHIVQIGDLYDFYCFSRFARTLNLGTPQQEVKRGRDMAEAFWARVRRLAPRAQCYQMIGNHEDRMIKRILDKVPELEAVIDVTAMSQFPGVVTMESSRDELRIGEIVFHHGHRSKLGDHMNYNMQSTVVGHSHLGGVVFKRYKNKNLFELNCGYIADERSKPLQYNAQKTVSWVAGYGVIDENGPRFCPLK